MNIPKMHIPKPLGAILIVLMLGVLFLWKAEQNYLLHNYINTNFFSFWLSGHMVWTGESPYNTTQWKAGFDAVGATYRPSQILQYPLPLMYFMAPIGWLPVGQAYFVWQLVTQAAVALMVFALLRVGKAPGWLVLPVMIFLLFFGPLFLTLQIGSVGVISLLAVGFAIVLLETGSPLWAGVALSVIFLKPPQALVLVILAVVWFVIRRQWRAIAGIAVGSLALLIVWMLREPQGLVKFLGSSGFLLGHTLGVQSNVFGFAYVACGRSESCMWVSGIIAVVAVIAIGATLLWHNREQWTDWQAFNLIIPLGFITAIYLYSYDQLLYIIMIVWVIARLMMSSRPYLKVFAFLVVVDLVSLLALTMEALTHLDFTSLATTVLMLGLCLWLSRKSTSGLPLQSASVAGAAPQRS